MSASEPAIQQRGDVLIDVCGPDSVAPVFESCAATYHSKNLPNALTVDVEDYFQVSAFEGLIDRANWDEIPTRVADNVSRLLDLFGEHGVSATFFTLGWVAKRYPELIKRIADNGHEIASHGDDHKRVTSMDIGQFRRDAGDTRKLLEDISGTAVIGYRAPSFSIVRESLWAHEVLAEVGYKYSSSIYPISHDHYGLSDAPRYPFNSGSSPLLEVPLTTVNKFGRNWPCAGGGYFRLLPYAYSRWALRHVNEVEKMPAVFYFHPWEIDPEQPRVKGIPARTRFRHYVNLNKFEARLVNLLQDFDWGRMDRIFLGKTGS